MFNVYTKEAGAAKLSISVEGPSKAVMNFEERTPGILICSYKVTKPGKITV